MSGSAAVGDAVAVAIFEAQRTIPLEAVGCKVEAERIARERHRRRLVLIRQGCDVTESRPLLIEGVPVREHVEELPVRGHGWQQHRCRHRPYAMDEIRTQHNGQGRGGPGGDRHEVWLTKRRYPEM